MQRYGDGIRGFGRLSDYGLRFLAMVSEKAQYRNRVVRFWQKYGLAPTMEDFEVKRRTLYHWSKKLSEGGHNLEALNDQRKAPRSKRKRLSPKEISEESRRLRTIHPNFSKKTLKRFVKVFCEHKKLNCPKVRNIGWMIADAPE